MNGVLRRVFWRWPALAQPLQPAAGMRRPRRLGHRQNPLPQAHFQFSDWLPALPGDSMRRLGARRVPGGMTKTQDRGQRAKEAPAAGKPPDLKPKNSWERNLFYRLTILSNGGPLFEFYSGDYRYRRDRNFGALAMVMLHFWRVVSIVRTLALSLAFGSGRRPTLPFGASFIISMV